MLSAQMMDAAVRAAAEPLNTIVWVSWCDMRAGWCVFRGWEGHTQACLMAGPFSTREAAEALLGPQLRQIGCAPPA